MIWNTIETTQFYYSDDSTSPHICLQEGLFLNGLENLLGDSAGQIQNIKSILRYLKGPNMCSLS